MNEELIKEIFIAIAFRAIEAGNELHLEKGKETSKSGVFGGAFSEASADHDSLSLHVYDGMRSENAEDQEENDGNRTV